MKHEKKYENQIELMMRFGVFRANKHEIDLHNSKDKSWKKEVNHFTDLTK